MGCGGSQAGPGRLALAAGARACNPVETGLMERIRSEPEPRRGVWRTGPREHAWGPTGALVAGRAGSSGGWPLSSPTGAEARVQARSGSRRLVGASRDGERTAASGNPELPPPGALSSTPRPSALLGSPLCSGPSAHPSPGGRGRSLLRRCSLPGVGGGSEGAISVLGGSHS